MRRWRSLSDVHRGQVVWHFPILYELIALIALGLAVVTFVRAVGFLVLIDVLVGKHTRILDVLLVHHFVQFNTVFAAGSLESAVHLQRKMKDE